MSHTDCLCAAAFTHFVLLCQGRLVGQVSNRKFGTNIILYFDI